MNGNVTFLDATTSSQPISADVEFFDPPICWPTGLCGPTLEQTLLDVNEMVIKLKEAGTKLERYQMGSHPNAFMQHTEVMCLIREKQMEALPITLVRGQVIKAGAYVVRGSIWNKLGRS